MEFAIVCEAPADRHISAELADRVLLDAVEWLEDGLLDTQRNWSCEVNSNGTTTELLWKHISSLARNLRIRIHGHFNGEPGLPDAAAARRALLVVKRLIDPDAVMLIRDADNQIVRRGGLNQARDSFSGPMKIVIGLANPEREAWVLSGFDPSCQDEENTLQTERQTLGFDPRHRSHDLTATNDDQADKSPKRVLKVLTNKSYDRESVCWRETELTVLRERGTGNGLNDFLIEVATELVPLITGQQDPKA